MSTRLEPLLVWGVHRFGGVPIRAKSTVRRRIERATTVHRLRSSPLSRTRVYACGWPATGALGITSFARPLNDRRNRQQVLVPARVAELTTWEVEDCAAGYGFSLFACKRGRRRQLLGCGVNSDGQLGDLHGRARQYSDELVTLLLRPSPVRLPLHPDELAARDFRILSLAAGRAHAIVATTRGAFALGDNSFGQCGREGPGGTGRMPLPCQPHEVRQVACSEDASFLITSDSRLFACGHNSDGRLGLGDAESADRLQRVTGELEAAEIVRVSCRGGTALALAADGRVYGWGSSEFGQVSSEFAQVDRPILLRHVTSALADANERPVEVAAGTTACGLVTDAGHVWVWGSGRLGLGPDIRHSERPQRLPPGLFGRSDLRPGVRVAQLECGPFHFAAVTNEGALYTWGDQTSGCLGLGHKESQNFPLRVSIGSRVEWVTCGLDHTLVGGRSYA